MRYKKIIMLTIIVTCLLAVSAVSATDNYMGGIVGSDVDICDDLQLNDIDQEDMYETYVEDDLNFNNVTNNDINTVVSNFKENEVISTGNNESMLSANYYEYSAHISKCYIKNNNLIYDIDVVPTSYNVTFQCYINFLDYDGKIIYYSQSSEMSTEWSSGFGAELVNYKDFGFKYPGTYTLNVWNKEDNHLMDTGYLYIKSDEDAIVSIKDKTYYASNPVKIDYTYKKRATGKLSIYLDDEYVKTIPLKEVIDLGYLDPGNYNLKVYYSGDGAFDSLTLYKSFKVLKAQSNLKINSTNFYFDEEVKLNYNIENRTTGNLSIYIDDSFVMDIPIGDEINLGYLDIGVYNLSVAYDGDSCFYSSKSKTTINILKYPSEISFDVIDINWNESLMINPNITSQTTGFIDVYVNDVYRDTFSIGSIYILNEIGGPFSDITLVYLGDDYFNQSMHTERVYVNRLNATCIIDDNIESGSFSNVHVDLNEDATGILTIIIGNNKYEEYLINGAADFSVPDFKAGTYDVMIVYNGDSKYDSFELSKTINVIRKNTFINLDLENILADEDILINPTIDEEATGYIDIYVDDIFKRTIKVKSSYTLNSPSIGQHKIKLIYSGDSYFNSNEAEFSFRVFNVYPIEAVDTQIVFGTDKKFQARFYDEYGEILANKYVLFIVNGDEYPIKTNNEGIAVLNVDLSIGEYNVTSVSILDENITNKLLVFHSVQAESMIIEYGSDTKFQAVFLDQSAKPLSKTNIVFNIDGKDTMVKTDVDGVAILNDDLTIGTHTITSINTITDENRTDKIVVVSDIDSIISIDVNDINYGETETMKITVDSGYLDENLTIKITDENGYEQFYIQSAKLLTKEFMGLNASKYYVDVYLGNDLLVKEKNVTFTVSKIDPTICINVEDTLIGDVATLTIDIMQATGMVEIMLGDNVYEEQLIDGKIVMELFDFNIGENTVKVGFKGNNNFNPFNNSITFKVWNNFNLDVDYVSEITADEEFTIDIYNLNDNVKNDNISLFIDDKPQNYELILWYDDEEEYHVQISFSGDLCGGEHTWRINYLDINNYINVSKSGTFDLIISPEPDTYRFVSITNKSIIYVPFDKITWNVKKLSVYDEYVAEYYDDAYVNYTFSTFTLNGIEYTIIESSINYPVASLYVSFNPNEYKQHDGIFYKVKDGKIVDAISVSEYENYDGVLYRYVGLGQMTFAENSEVVTYVLINGECYKVIGTLGSFQSVFYKAILNTDYKMANGKFYTLDGEIIENFLDELYGSSYTIVNGTFYDIDGNIYTPHSVWSIGYPLISNNGQLEKVVYGNDFNNTYAVSAGQLCYVGDGTVGAPVKIDMTHPISEDEISIPSLDNVSLDESVEIKLPSDATGTVTLTVNGNDYKFDVVNGVANVKLPELTNGDYNYTITYSGDSKYRSFTNVGSMNVNKTSEVPVENTTVEPEVIIPPLDEPSDNGTIAITLPNDATGTVTLTVNGKDYTFDVKEGTANIKLPKLSNGDYEYTITYSGDSKYTTFTKSGSMKVNNTQTNTTGGNTTGGNTSENTTIEPEITIPPLDKPSDDGSVTITLPSDATGKVTLSINGKNYVYLVENGLVNFVLPNLGNGDYPYTITYSGDSKYSSFATNSSLTIKKDIPTKITAPAVTTIYNSSGFLVATLSASNDDALVGAEVFITINGVKNQFFTDDNGQVKMSLIGLTPKTYTATIVFEGNASYAKSSKSVKVTVMKADTKLIIGDLSGIVGHELTITAKVSSGNLTVDGGIVTFYDGETVIGEANINNGVATITYAPSKDGKHEITVVYGGNAIYRESNTTTTLTVSDYSNIIASNVKVTYNAGSYYTLTVYGTDGKLATGDSVIITVNGKTFKTLTTTNGVAKFKVTNVPGTYKMNITALGKSVTKTLTVKHIVTLKTVTVKKSAKKIVLQATLAKINGKYLKNKKITFKFNGKKYTAKTDKKGVAKVTIKSSVLKKLKVGKKVTYQATYLKDTVKKTAKIKK